MITECLHQLFAPYALHYGRPRVVNESVEESIIRLCPTSQHDRASATTSGVIDFLTAEGIAIGRFWVRNFVQRQRQRLCLQTARGLEKDQHDVLPDDIKQYFQTLSVQIRSIPAAFMWNADEMRVRCTKNISATNCRRDQYRTWIRDHP
jgi:hypothetical protein